jgi:hypothetical protein
MYEGVTQSYRTGRLERELQMVQLSAIRFSFIAILWVSVESFAVITLCVASQRVFVVVYFVNDSVRKLFDTPSYISSFIKIGTLLSISLYLHKILVGWWNEAGWDGQTCSIHRREKNSYKFLSENLKGRPRHRWEDNIRLNLRETGWKGVVWIHLAQDRDRWRAVVNTIMNLRFL